MTLKQKIEFLKSNTPRLLEGLRAKTSPWWGSMTAQHMIEHLTASIEESTGKIASIVATPEANLAGAKEWLMGDKEFKQNLKHPLLKDTLEPLKNKNIVEAYSKFVEELNHFFDVYAANPSQKNNHIGYGSLNFEEWVQCHYKHFTHHLKQFDLIK